MWIFKSRNMKGGHAMSDLSARYAFCFLISLVAAFSISATPPSGRSWQLQWADEFEGTIDRTIWNNWNDNSWRDNNGHHVFLNGAKCLSVANGGMVITVIKGGDTAYAAGLQSKNKYGAGYYEARCKSGIAWSCFWVQAVGADCSDQAAGAEFDIMENCCPGTLWHAVNWSGYGSCHQYTTHGLGAGQNAFHTYGMWWSTDSGAIFYYDGQRTWSQPNAKANANTGWVRLTTESENIGATFETDYVRYYKDMGPGTAVTMPTSRTNIIRYNDNSARLFDLKGRTIVRATDSDKIQAGNRIVDRNMHLAVAVDKNGVAQKAIVE
jgi:hypothetical protein